jgi:hypothetical protein
MTPKKFDWTVHFLNSSLWEFIKHPIENENIISFMVPDKCVAQQAPTCKLSEISDEESYMETPAAPVRKRKSKVPLVETEVAEEGIDSKLMKKSKLSGKGKAVAVQKKASFKEKGDKDASSSLGRGKPDIAAEGCSQQNKKKPHSQSK